MNCSKVPNAKKRLIKQGVPCKQLLISIVILGISACQSDRIKIEIISKNLSHRILLLDSVETRLNLIIGFTISSSQKIHPEKLSASAKLSYGPAEIATCMIPKLDYSGGNLNFYLPFQIKPGDYHLNITIFDRLSDAKVTSQDFIIDKIEALSCRETNNKKNWMNPPPIVLNNPPDEIPAVIPSQIEKERGYFLWHRNPFKYVYPNSAPKQSDLFHSMTVQLARNEYEPATFSLYALENIGNVEINVSGLIGETGAYFPSPDIYTVKTVPRIKSNQSQEKTYELRPRLLWKTNGSFLKAKKSQRFWLTFHATGKTPPGVYSGHIFLKTNSGKTAIPIHIKVLPFMLRERPDKEYGFMMTYAFQEMTASDLSEKERQQIYQNGLKYYRSFKEHGLTTISPHSPFTFRRMPNGNPDLRDLKASLKAFIEVGFSGPFIYYCGHLVQSAKPGWAGSSLSFDSKRHPILMKEIISYARRHFPEMNQTDFYWMPVDEAQDNKDGPDRMKMAGSLLNAIRQMKEKTAITRWGKTQWKTDITLGDPKPVTGEHWQYPNDLTAVPDSVDDAESIRRQFGLSHVKSDYIGILPWTFQTSENASGDPYTDLDNNGRAEVMIAYPGTDGPMPTPEYEAVREGIDDGRYACLLETMIEKAKQSTDSAQQKLGWQAESALRKIMLHPENASLEEMDQNREIITYWILRLIPHGSQVSGNDTHKAELSNTIAKNFMPIQPQTHTDGRSNAQTQRLILNGWPWIYLMMINHRHKRTDTGFFTGRLAG